jgi:hypothetical protein
MALATAPVAPARPPSSRRRVAARRVSTKRCGGCVETAPGPERVTPDSRYSLDFAVKVDIDKYLDHIPLARQEWILKRCSH